MLTWLWEGCVCVCSGGSCWRFKVQGILCVFVIKCLSRLLVFSVVVRLDAMLVGPCHHGMARPQVVDRGTASDKEGSYE